VTTGLIHGIDSKNVGAVIFRGVTYGLLNLYQESGQTGRDGQPSWSVILHAGNNMLAYSKLKQLGEDTQCLKQGEDWLQSKECQQFGFSRALDNEEVPCRDLEDAHFVTSVNQTQRFKLQCVVLSWILLLLTS